MTDNDHIRETYAHFGLAVYLAQVLEHGIVNAMIVLRLPRKAEVTRHDIDAFMDGQFKSTLGKLIRHLQAETALPFDLEQLLDDALKKRNWLCHHYFRERAVDFMSFEGRDRMIAELQALQSLLQRADKALEATVRPLAEKFGVNQGSIDAEYQRLLREQRIGSANE